MSTPDNLDGEAPYINVLVGGQTDGPNLGITDQGKDSSFVQEFFIKSHDKAFDRVTSMKHSLEFQQPMITGLVEGEKNAVLPSASYSFIKEFDPGLIVWSVKPAEEGTKNKGIIMRIWNLNESFSKSPLVFANNVSAASETTHVEIDLDSIAFKKNSVVIGIESQRMKTFRIKF